MEHLKCVCDVKTYSNSDFWGKKLEPTIIKIKGLTKDKIYNGTILSHTYGTTYTYTSYVFLFINDDGKWQSSDINNFLPLDLA